MLKWPMHLIVLATQTIRWDNSKRTGLQLVECTVLCPRWPIVRKALLSDVLFLNYSVFVW